MSFKGVLTVIYAGFLACFVCGLGLKEIQRIFNEANLTNYKRCISESKDMERQMYCEYEYQSAKTILEITLKKIGR